MERVKDVDLFPNPRQVNHSIRAARTVRAHLPNRFDKTAQDLGALVLLSDLSLVQCETELLLDRSREPASRSSESTSQITFRGLLAFSDTFHYMPVLA